MKYLGYIAMPIDLLLANSHYLYTLSPASDEWYISDVCQAARILLWGMVGLFWIKSFKAERMTVGWYMTSVFLDFIQTVLGGAGGNPTIEIIIFIAGAIVIQTFYLDGHASKKESEKSD